MSDSHSGEIEQVTCPGPGCDFAGEPSETGAIMCKNNDCGVVAYGVGEMPVVNDE